ncbi:MAG TPA: ribbon-helix-helix protein, CopG family [Gaiellaceae bacterium]|jgi:metal-responsive CopG/Arc/MetJ family transcriptional regulator|nr:ribbon-helix-helix protein, CopG family [Gaiellaceae bacterium]
MAKVMISLPDALLARVDAEARRRGTTRSGLVQQLATDALHVDQTERIEAMRALNAQAGHYGGTGLAALKADRARDDRR